MAAVETKTIEPIPESERHGRTRDLFTLWFSANMQITTIASVAFLTSLGLSLPWLIAAIVVGNLIGGIFMAYHSAQGPIIGVPQMIQSRAQFGYYGSLLPVGIVIIMYIGFWASSAVLGGQALDNLFHGGTTVGILVVFVVTTLLAIYGYDYIHAFQRYLSVVFFVAFVLLTVSLLSDHHLSAKALAGGGFSWGTFLLAVSVPLSWQITYAPYVSDYSRYLPKDVGVGPTFWATYGGTCISTVWMMILGALLTLYNGKVGPVTAIGALSGSLSWLMMLIILLGVLAADVLNSYGGMLSVETFAGTFGELKTSQARRSGLIVAIGAIGTLIAILGQGNFLENLTNFILFLLYLFVPWTAINLTDFYLVRHGRYDQAAFYRPAGYGGFNWAALLAYVLGFLVELPFVNTVLYEGPLAKAMGGADISWIPGIVVSAGLYLLFAQRRTTA